MSFPQNSQLLPLQQASGLGCLLNRIGKCLSRRKKIEPQPDVRNATFSFLYFHVDRILKPISWKCVELSSLFAKLYNPDARPGCFRLGPFDQPGCLWYLKTWFREPLVVNKALSYQAHSRARGKIFGKFSLASTRTLPRSEETLLSSGWTLIG